MRKRGYNRRVVNHKGAGCVKSCAPCGLYLSVTCGVEQWLACVFDLDKVAGSNPAPATIVAYC